MILKVFRSLLCASAVLGGQALAQANDEALLGAYDAYRAGDPLKFARFAKKLDGHLLDPWVDYWRIAMRLEDTPNAEVLAFLDEHANTYPAEMLRGDWLKVLGKRGEWAEFGRQFALYPRDDLEIRCYQWLHGMQVKPQGGDSAALADVESVWLEPREWPEGCARLGERMVAAGRVSVSDVWRRVRVLFERGQITAAKSALGYLSKAESPDERLLAEAARQPKRVLERLPRSLEKRPVREVVVLAVVRHARNDPEGSAKILEAKLASRLPEADLAYLWGRIGYEAAREHHPSALKWYARGDTAQLDLEQLAWKTRAALRAGRWDVVRETIDLMPAGMRQENAWAYWYGRALAAQGEDTGGRAYFLRIAGETDFYGLLASEELGYVSTLPDTMHVPTEADVEAARKTPGIARSLELIRLGIRTEGVREWLFTVRYFDDPRLLGAAEMARRAEIWDRSISAADRTVRSHNFALRYPLPYREVFSEYSKTYGLDEAWVLGLVRQESRFITDARSAAGAAGLMQVMPRTARFVAHRIGLRDYQRKGVTEVQTNVNLGSGYLKIVLDQLGNPVLASAAYNAGPGRAKRWRDTARALEGAVYVETIPFPETRDYVKKVMANSVFYAALISKQPALLKPRLGTIAPRGAGEPIEDDTP
jgi:soluble lytic murein transglycosylase